ncbi:MAG: LLM class F420-dependent oxidoreductase [Vulcanimicrobiota bacterium]
MKIGVVYPQTEIGTTPTEVRDYAQGVAELGYTHFLAYEHVVGGDPEQHPELKAAPYDLDSRFQEPFVLFGYLAGIVPHMGFVTGIVILPQRQATLVAKQASVVDVLSDGKFRLGVGLGWNPIEYEALGQKWSNRARRFEEQIELMRELLSQKIVTFDGKYHKVTAAGLNPLPVQRPLPIWIGAAAEPAIRRAARIADGFFPLRKPEGSTWADEIEKLHGYLEEYGRDPRQFGIEVTLRTGNGSPEDWCKEMEEWKRLGASHLCIHTMGCGLSGVDAHLQRLKQVAETFGLQSTN